ncbi:unnamed protein product [Pleuronectes platessa]|uniref:Uncharacterized protein n=1 Tax=Pleuronectes platessa TaxID=8262 RepID=A0A9N7UMU5_PLEPL|nr:unnamed protein product [Pleuronectes platessa]
MTRGHEDPLNPSPGGVRPGADQKAPELRGKQENSPENVQRPLERGVSLLPHQQELSPSSSSSALEKLRSLSQSRRPLGVTSCLLLPPLARHLCDVTAAEADSPVNTEEEEEEEEEQEEQEEEEEEEEEPVVSRVAKGIKPATLKVSCGEEVRRLNSDGEALNFMNEGGRRLKIVPVMCNFPACIPPGPESFPGSPSDGVKPSEMIPSAASAKLIVLRLIGLASWTDPSGQD